MTAEKQAANEVDLDYAGVQKLAALRDAVRTEGGLAGAGMQIGAGVQLAKEFFNTNNNNTTAPVNETTTTTPDASSRLKQLKQLFEEELITEEEYNKKKNEILGSL